MYQSHSCLPGEGAEPENAEGQMISHCYVVVSSYRPHPIWQRQDLRQYLKLGLNDATNLLL
jgi:hypothetical protein